MNYLRAHQPEIGNNVPALHFLGKRSEVLQVLFNLAALDKGALAGFAVDQPFAREIMDGAPDGRTAQILPPHKLVLGRQGITGFVHALGDFRSQNLTEPAVERRKARRSHHPILRPAVNSAILHDLNSTANRI